MSVRVASIGENSTFGQRPLANSTASPARLRMSSRFERIWCSMWRPRIHTFVGTSDLHIEHQMRSNREDILKRAGEAVQFAKDLCPNVEFSPMDATRTDIGYLSEVVAAAVEAGADVVNIADTVGYTTPVEFAAFLKELQERVPGLKDRVLSVHCHDDLGMAVAS